MYKSIKELESIFEASNSLFLIRNPMLFEMQVSERTLCGALMLEIYQEIQKKGLTDYFVDVEYNRNVGGKLKTYRKTMEGPTEDIVTINCDLIVHSRGQNAKRDNLIAIEMKKSTAKKDAKNKDRIRLECLTKSPQDDIWNYGGRVFPKHVCGYRLGVYYEINFNRKRIFVEYYREGYCYKKYVLKLNGEIDL